MSFATFGKRVSNWLQYGRKGMAQMAATDKAFKREKEMWNLQNEYNTPAAQMQRYKDAGLNPMLLYSQGSSGNASSAPNVPIPDMSVVPNVTDVMQNASSAVGMLQQFKAMEQIGANISLTRANEALTRQKTINEAFTPILNQLDIDTKSFDLGQKQQLLPYNLQIAATNAAKGQIANKQAEYELSQMSPERLRKLKLENDISAYDLKNMKPAELKKLLQEYINLQKSAGLMDSQTNKSIQELENLKLDYSMKNLEYEMQSRLKEYNLTPNDNIFIRWLNTLKRPTIIPPKKRPEKINNKPEVFHVEPWMIGE